MSGTIDAGHFLLARQLVSAALKALEQGVTVTDFSLQLQTGLAELDVDKGSYAPPSFLPVEFQICIKSLDGKKLPRVTQARAKRIAAARGA